MLFMLGLWNQCGWSFFQSPGSRPLLFKLFPSLCIQRLGRLREGVARWFFQQLVLGLDYCHKRGVANRDIKLENTLLQVCHSFLYIFTYLHASTTDHSKRGHLNCIEPQLSHPVLLSACAVPDPNNWVPPPHLQQIWLTGELDHCQRIRLEHASDFGMFVSPIQ